jgi:enoyl-CoA hydratase/carnithine racemase
MIITLNREDKQNALSLLMYLKITELMNKASADDKI